MTGPPAGFADGPSAAEANHTIVMKRDGACLTLLVNVGCPGGWAGEIRGCASGSEEGDVGLRIGRRLLIRHTGVVAWRVGHPDLMHAEGD